MDYQKCEHCGNLLQTNEIYCKHCGLQTPLIEKHLAFLDTVKSAWRTFKARAFLGFGILYSLLAILPLIVVGILVSDNYWLLNLWLVVWLPMALVPFAGWREWLEYRYSISMYISDLRTYPTFLGFSIIAVVAMIPVKIICSPMPLFYYPHGPILNLVQVVLFFWWISILIPVPMIMIRDGYNPLQAIILAYRKARELRWQIFFLYMFLLGVNIIGALVAGIGLIITLPFSILAIVRYTDTLRTFNVLPSAEPVPQPEE